MRLRNANTRKAWWQEGNVTHSQQTEVHTICMRGSNGEIKRYLKPATEQVLKESTITKHLKADGTVGGISQKLAGKNEEH